MRHKELNGIAGLTNAKKGLTVFVARPFLMPRLAIALPPQTARSQYHSADLPSLTNSTEEEGDENVSWSSTTIISKGASSDTGVSP